jgi:hypothetical protein
MSGIPSSKLSPATELFALEFDFNIETNEMTIKKTNQSLHHSIFVFVEIVLEFPIQPYKMNQLLSQPTFNLKRKKKFLISKANFENIIFFCTLIKNNNHLIDRLNNFIWR